LALSQADPTSHLNQVLEQRFENAALASIYDVIGMDDETHHALLTEDDAGLLLLAQADLCRSRSDALSVASRQKKSPTPLDDVEPPFLPSLPKSHLARYRISTSDSTTCRMSQAATL
jgi:hypothetical protein